MSRSRSVRVVVEPVVAGLAALVLAVLLGLTLGAVLMAVPGDDRDGWADLANVVVAMLVSAAVGVVLWVLALVWAARRLFGPGRRLGVVVWAVVAGLLVAVLVGTVGQGIDDVAPLGEAWAATALLAPLAPGLVFWLWDRRARTAQVGAAGDGGRSRGGA